MAEFGSGLNSGILARDKKTESFLLSGADVTTAPAGVLRRRVPRHRARQRAARRLPGRLGPRALSSAPRPLSGQFSLSPLCLLPDDEPYSPGSRDGDGAVIADRARPP